MGVLHFIVYFLKFGIFTHNFDRSILAVFNAQYISPTIFEQKKPKPPKKEKATRCNEIGAGRKITSDLSSLLGQKYEHSNMNCEGNV